MISSLQTVFPRHLSTVEDLAEMMSCSEAEYPKVAIIVELPCDLGVRGVLIQSYIDSSPDVFPSSQRSGFISKALNHREEFSMRITHSSLLTLYDSLPQFVPHRKFVRQFVLVPVYHFTFTSDLGFKFSPEIFVQIFSRSFRDLFEIFSRSNAVKGVLRLFKLCFDVDNKRYEIVHLEEWKFKVTVLFDESKSHRSRIEVASKSHPTHPYASLVSKPLCHNERGF
jgi:hypothetical protein